MSEQAMAALKYGNDLRLEGGRIRRIMGEQSPDESRRCAAELLRDPPEAIAHMRTGHFLSGIQRFGQKQAMRYIRLAGLSGEVWDRRVGPLDKAMDKGGRLTLTDRQREALAEVITERLL